MKKFILFALIIFCFPLYSQVNPYADEDYDLSQKYVKCDLTGKETEYYVQLTFGSGKQVDEEIYNLIQEEFDSAMQKAFDIFWHKKYIEYESTRGINAFHKKQTALAMARINLLEAQFKYDEELNISNDSTLILEYCDLIDENNMWVRGWEYCEEFFKKVNFSDTTYLYRIERF